MQSELVARAQRGDREAFSTLAHGASPRLSATARLILRQPDRAEDAVQDALIEAWRDIRGLRDPERLDAWLYRLLVRACHRHLRKELRRRITEMELPAWHRDPTADAAATLADRDEIERAFHRLTAEQRTILVLVYSRDWTLNRFPAAMRAEPLS